MKSVIVSSLLAAAALASPHGQGHRHVHRDLAPRRAATDYVIVTEWVTVTKYYGEEPTQANGQSYEQESTSVAAESTSVTAESTSTTVVEPVTTLSTVVAPSSTSVHETPTPPPSEPSTPASATSSAPPIIPSQPPVQYQASPPPKSTKTPPPPTDSGNDTNTPTSGGVQGKLTYYSPALGACGGDNSGDEYNGYIVALSYKTMGELSNGNPFCGRKVTISANGKTCVATVVDKCMGCEPDHIDGNPNIMKYLFGSLDGGVEPVTFSIDYPAGY